MGCLVELIDAVEKETVEKAIKTSVFLGKVLVPEKFKELQKYFDKAVEDVNTMNTRLQMEALEDNVIIERNRIIFIVMFALLLLGIVVTRIIMKKMKTKDRKSDQAA